MQYSLEDKVGLDMMDHSALYREVGGMIRAHRGKQLSQEALASAVGLTRTSISNIEKGRQKLLLHTFVDIAAALNIEAAALLPAKPVPALPVPEETLAGLVKSDSERVFIESAIGFITQKGTHHGHQEKEDPGTGTLAARRSEDRGGAGARVGHHPGKRSPDRR